MGNKSSNSDLNNEEIENLLSKIKFEKFQRKISFDEFELIKSIKEFDLSKIDDKKEKKAIACFVGSAIGDAAGVHTEFSDLAYDN